MSKLQVRIHEGSARHRIESKFDLIESYLFSANTPTSSSAHIRFGSHFVCFCRVW